jgi:hypothetical protein
LALTPNTGNSAFCNEDAGSLDLLSEMGAPAMSELTERTNQADIAAVTEVVLSYYEGDDGG